LAICTLYHLDPSKVDGYDCYQYQLTPSLFNHRSTILVQVKTNTGIALLELEITVG